MLKSIKEEGYEYQSKLAKKSFGLVEGKLPKPKLTLKDEEITPAMFLVDIVQYARGAESRGEWLFRKNYLLPWIDHMLKGRETDNTWQDAMGNIIVHVGEEPMNTLHVGHIDSVHPDDGSPYQEVHVTDRKEKGKDFKALELKPIVKHSEIEVISGKRWYEGTQIDYDYIKYSLPQAPRRCLGADDGCAVAIMLYLIFNGVEGTYLFTRGEERGCVGTHYMIANQDTSLDFSLFKRAIEVDRKGLDEIITKMSPGITASNTFANSLAKQLGMGHKPSTLGSITDVGHLARFIPECVNVAAGYWKQHTDSEYCIPAYLNELGRKMLLVEWDDLASERKEGEYVVPLAKRPPMGRDDFDDFYSHGSRKSYGGGVSRTFWGDYGEDLLDKDGTFEELLATDFAVEGFVRRSNALLSEVLRALDMSPAELHTLALCGLRPDADPRTLIDYSVLLDEEEDEVELEAEDTNGSSES